MRNFKPMIDTTDKTKHHLVRNMPRALHSQLKAEAAHREITMQDYIIDILMKRHIERKDG